ncbi:hypothetical protein [Chitinophaga caseinilytica]|uniref:Uncharacterized protein n=1 Tax=Chitinophaga caseinilytica TaxID=2267521 RepID=A0ABZ2Z9Y6_9BACT
MEQDGLQQKQHENWFQGIRAMFLPLKPGDGPVVRTLKDSAFYLFGTLALIISVSLAGVILMVV